MLNAMRTLTDMAETGAVTIALPQDVQGGRHDYPVEFFEKRVHYIERRIPSDTQLDRLAELVRGAKKPMIIAGGGVRYSEGGDELAAVCERYAIPFGETQAGKGTVLWDNPYNMSGIGVTGSQASNRLAQEADLIIGWAPASGDFTTCSKWLFQNPECKFVSINVAGADAYKLNSLPIIADAKLTLAALSEHPALAGYTIRGALAWQRRSGCGTGEVAGCTERSTHPCSPKHGCSGELNDHLLPHSAIVVSGSGSIERHATRLENPGGGTLSHGVRLQLHGLRGRGRRGEDRPSRP